MRKNLKNINKKIIFSLIIILIIVMKLLNSIYLNQKEAIIEKQRKELINLSQVASMQLEDFFEDKVLKLDEYFEGNVLSDSDLIEDEINKLRNIDSKFLERIEYLSENQIYDYYLKSIDIEIIDYYVESALNEGGTIIGPWIYSNNGYYNLHLIKPVIINEVFQGAILAEYNLNNIYDETIGNIKVGDYGYCTLKDNTGIILMHGDKKQIGIDSLEGRKEKYPDLDPEGIERLVNNQLKGQSGSDIVESYWWGENEVKQVKKIIGYSPVKIGEYNWIVNSIMSYDEITKPIEAGMDLMIFLMVIVIIISIVFVYYIIRVKYEREEAVLKLKYTEELNVTVNKLRKHEESLSHNNRIQTLGIMSSMMVHDIKNMIMPIFIYTELIKEEAKENKNIISDINEIENVASNCLNLSKGILGYSTSKDNLEVFDSVKEVTDVIKMIKSIIPKNIELIVKIPNYEILMKGNNTEFKQIILNLCTNSYQAMEVEGGVLNVNYYKVENRAVLEVKDTGIGIEKDMQEKIFEPFFTMKSKDTGTGLGLSIVAELVKKHNGYITLESEVMEGSRFNIIFNL